MKSRKAILALGGLILVAAAAFGAIMALSDPKEPELPPQTTETRALSSDEEWSGTIVENGITYRVNPNIHTVLLLGVDDGTVIPNYENTDAEVAGTGGRADTILLLLLNDDTKAMTLLSVSRDTMTDVDAYGTDGHFAYTYPTHLNMQYAYGDSPTRSAYLMKKAVSRLLYGTRIDGFMSVKIEGIRAIVDSLGGLQLTVPEDYTEIDERFTKGARITLTGAEAEHLLRYRDTGVHASNETRVQRQLRLIETVFSELGGRLGGERLEEAIDAAGDAMATDLDAETLKKLASYQLEAETYTLPGSVTEGEDHDEFHVEEEALRKLLIGLYYMPVEP